MKALITLLAFSLIISCKTTTVTPPAEMPQQSGAITAITNVNLVDMTNEGVKPNKTVVIQNGKILRIDDSGTVQGESITMIDGSGKYLIPGLSEMHAHLPVPNEGDDAQVRETMFLYLANGVTLIRGMLGNPYHLQLREKVENGEILGPRIYSSSPSINGNSVPDIETAKKVVQQYQKEGYDFLKIHPGIQLDVFNAIVQTAKQVDIDYAGHVPADVGIRRAISAGYASIDHADGYLEGLVPQSAGVKPEEGGFFGFNFSHLVDLNMMPALAKSTKAAGVAVVPTQSLMTRVTSGRSPEEILNEPEMKYLPAATRYQWRQQGRNWMQGATAYNPTTAKRFIEVRNFILKSLHDEGVPLLLGSDSPQVYNVPGFSIHHELEDMIDAGLSPFEALQTGTTKVAAYFGRSSELGTIETGKAADLVLLDANPLEDIKNAKKVRGVLIRGKWIPKETIDQRLAEIAAKYAFNN